MHFEEQKAILHALLLATYTHIKHSHLINIKKLSLNGTQCVAAQPKNSERHQKHIVLLEFTPDCSDASQMRPEPCRQWMELV